MDIYDVREQMSTQYPLIFKSVEDLRNGDKDINKITDQFYFNVGRIIEDTHDAKPILIGVFIKEMAKAICYILEEYIDGDYNEYFVLTFNDIDSLNVTSNCTIVNSNRLYFAFSNAGQPIGAFLGREYMYKHQTSLTVMLNFINNLRDNFHVAPIKPMEIESPIKMNIVPSVGVNNTTAAIVERIPACLKRIAEQIEADKEYKERLKDAKDLQISVPEMIQKVVNDPEFKDDVSNLIGEEN